MTDTPEIAALVERLRNDHAPYWDRQASCARGPETARGYYQRVDQSLRAAALITSLAEERDRMREALEPFAKVGRALTGPVIRYDVSGAARTPLVSAEDFARADALAPTPASKEPEHG